MHRGIAKWAAMAAIIGAALAAAPAGAAGTDPAPPVPKIINPDYDGLTVPWQVALVHRGATSLFDGQFCGGTIRDATHIITAAHCVAPDSTPGEIQVVAGITDLGAPTANTEIRNVAAISNIPRYQSAETGGDAALLTLATPLTGNPVVGSLAVATQGADDTGDAALISGWGDMDPGADDVFPTKLQAAYVQLLPDSACSKYGSDYQPATMLCAGRTNTTGSIVDTCQGDSGGPLSHYSGDGSLSDLKFDTLVGIVSWGNGCAQPGFPGIYTYVAGAEINRFVRTANPIPRPVNVGAPSVAGTLRVGSTIACNPGTWSGAPGFRYLWLRIPLVGGRPDANRAAVAGTARALRLTAADQGRVMACLVRGVNGGGWMQAASNGFGPVAPAGVTTGPGTKPVVRDVTAPTSSFTRAHCKRRRCTLTLRVSDVGGLAGERVTATIKRLTGCPHGRRGRACRRTRALAVRRGAPGVFTITTRRLAPGRYRIRARAVDAAGNVQAHPAQFSVRVRRR
jgi:Trypsin